MLLKTMADTFRGAVIITPEKRVLNQDAVDARAAQIAEWAKSDEAKEDGAECPFAPIEPVEGRTFDYETPLHMMESCVASAFRHAIKELRAIPHVQRYIIHARDVMKRLTNDGVANKADFAWMSQLRYYWDDGDLWAEMVAARRKYG